MDLIGTRYADVVDERHRNIVVVGKPDKMNDIWHDVAQRTQLLLWQPEIMQYSRGIGGVRRGDLSVKHDNNYSWYVGSNARNYQLDTRQNETFKSPDSSFLNSEHSTISTSLVTIQTVTYMSRAVTWSIACKDKKERVQLMVITTNETPTAH